MTAAAMPIIADALRQALRFICKKQINSWNSVAWNALTIADLLFYPCAFIILIVIAYGPSQPSALTQETYITILGFYVIAVPAIALFVTALFIPIPTPNDREFAIVMLPPVLICVFLFAVAMMVYTGGKEIIRAIPTILLFLALFVVNCFRLIHTTDRLICAVDAFLFAMLAYGAGALGNSWLAGSVLVHLAVFSIAGGAFGVLNKMYIKPVVETLADKIRIKISA